MAFEKYSVAVQGIMKNIWNCSFFHINHFKHNVEKCPNILEKSCGLKYVSLFFNIMHEKIKTKIAFAIYFNILYILPICNLLKCCLVVVEKSTPTKLF